MKISLPFLTRHSVEHSVNGQDLTFYQISTGTFMRLRSVAKPIMKAFGVLFSDKKQDTGQESVQTKSGRGEEQSRVRIDAVSPDVLKLRDEQRERALEQLLEGSLGSDAAMAVADLLWDALPDTLPKDASAKDKAEFVQGLTLSVLIEFLKGVAKANEELLAPFKDRADLATSALRRVLGDESPEQEEPSPETQTTQSG